MKSICLISGSSPKFLGGISLYQRNLINYAKKANLDLNFTWVYPGRKNSKYKFEGMNCIELKSAKYPFLKEFSFSKKVRKYLKKNNFDIINSHANWGYFLNGYMKKQGQKIIHTYHGVTYYFYKTHLRRFNFFLKILISPALFLSYILEKPPIKKADKIICVSNRVRGEIKKLYGRSDSMVMIRTGVDLKQFKRINKQISRKKLNLNNDKIYGLYVGRGGWFRKGLDRATKLSEEFYNRNKNFRLIVVGSDKSKIKKFIKKSFVEYVEKGERKILPYYYSSSDMFFCFSRYEGGAPILTLSEAMASESLIVCSKDAKQEIIKNKKEGLIINEFGAKTVGNILKVLENKYELNRIKKNALERIRKLDLDSWSKKYFGVLLG